jgi:hypothetical protein
VVVFGSEPVNDGDNQIDIRVISSSGDVVDQVNEQAERGFIYILKFA